MTALLVTVALLTLTVCCFAAVIAVRILRERGKWRRVRRVRPTLILGEAQADEEEEVSDVAACLQVWLDERWHERFG